MKCSTLGEVEGIVKKRVSLWDMERDLELVRDILLFVQKDENINKDVEIAGVSKDVIKGHVKIMHDMGLITAHFTNSGYFIGEIKPLGYDFIDKVKDDTAWRRLKATLVEKGIALTIDSVIAAIRASFT